MLSPTIPLQAKWLREKLLTEALKRSVTVALGVGAEREGYPEKVGHEARVAIERGIAKVKLVGAEEAIKKASRTCQDVEVVISSNPEAKIVEVLANGEVNAVVRGTLSAKKVMSELKRLFNIDVIHRIALLETYNGTAFLLAPVGIDEGNDVDDKMRLVEGGIKLLSVLGISPFVAILSGGRLEDYGRSFLVDETLNQAEELVKRIRRDLRIEAHHYGILIEDAVKSSNLVIAPNGMMGNMIFRVLTLIGGGRAFGAPVIDILPKVFVDVSRAMDSYLDSITLSAALVNMLHSSSHTM
ncbi:MAG: methanogenesis marker protein Mmp4/MtxX [Candidatus Nezhaarchaeota archaeon]|nr:methanogenesis marker protein Mmp4/MtxX [Candidatus Nezhaarchaeota archaeon]MCX8141517.1 methanogenesis marker protein Mmp4/MtxX [Candidatus Nezhaarchaeota archaeon]MDW8049784.1 methanogenesis marker protein Mmp4/MtxX [Nitrososphaerota archaeon]